VTLGLTACSARSHSMVRVMCDVTNPGPLCQWSQSDHNHSKAQGAGKGKKAGRGVPAIGWQGW
jgi:hypothetical protein